MSNEYGDTGILIASLQRSTEQLEAENTALKEQVAQLELIKDEHDERGIDIDILVQNLNSAEAKLTTLQSKSAALVDALESFALIDLGRDAVPSTFGMSVLVARKALAAFKGEK